MSDDQIVARLILLIRRTEADRQRYRQQGHMIDAAACAIRIRALQDAIDAVGPVPSGDKAREACHIQATLEDDA